MNVVSRGIRNAFRNYIRTIAIVVIIGLSIGLSLSMLVARQAVNAKINSVKASVGTSISISPAGSRGFSGGGNPLTTTSLAKINSLPHVTSLNESLEDRLTTSETTLTSSINPGTLGQRFAQSSGQSFSLSGGGGAGFGGGTSPSVTTTFTLPITVVASTTPTNLNSTTDEGGGTFKLTSGSVFTPTTSADVAMIGSGLASKNNLKVGSTFTAYSKTITVVGIFNAGNSFTNAELIMPLTTLQTLSGQSGDVTSATVTADTLGNVTSVTNKITKLLGTTADVTNEAQTAQSTVTPLENIRTITLYSLLGAVIAGSVIILLTMIMIVRERRREIGVLKAIGASNLKVMWQFMTEAVTLTLLGAIIGILIGVAAASPITKLLVNNSTPTATTTTVSRGGGFGGGGGAGFGGVSNPSTSGTYNFRSQATHGSLRGIRNSFSDIHTVVGWNIILYGVIAAIIIALLGSTAASFFIAKVRPAEVMRVE